MSLFSDFDPEATERNAEERHQYEYRSLRNWLNVNSGYYFVIATLMSLCWLTFDGDAHDPGYTLLMLAKRLVVLLALVVVVEGIAWLRWRSRKRRARGAKREED